MIDFALDDELALLRDTTRDFGASWLHPREREHEAARTVAPEVRETFAEIGLAGLELPEELGGAEMGALARVLVLEELGAADAGAALDLDPLGPAFYGLRALGAERLREFLPALLREPGARAVLVVGDALEVRGDRVHGSVPWVPADRVDLLVSLGREEILLVQEGIEREAVRGAGLRCAGASSVVLDGAPLRARLRDPQASADALARARLYVAALLVGVMRAAADTSRAYALERVTFGRPIAHHQSLAFLIADMASAVEGSRLLVQEAAWRLERGLDTSEACATAFLEAVEQSMFVTPNGIQILGGHGFMQDYPLEKWMRDARALGLLLGGADAAREEAGAELAADDGPVELSVPEA
ncbi:MAG: acyl-CoA dehydrogenase family protein [Myxococcota bacterium]